MTDTNNSIDTAYHLDGGSFTGHFAEGEIINWVALELEAGVTYSVWIMGSAARAGTLEFMYTSGIYDADGQRLSGVEITNSNFHSSFAINRKLVFTPTESGTYYFDIESFGEIGSYTVRLTVDEIGTDGDDSLVAGDLHALLDGGAGDDVLIGGAGNDELIAGSDNDTLTGGAGSDNFVFYSARSAYDVFPGRLSATNVFGQNVITDFTPGEDVVRFDGYLIRRFEDLDITQDGNDAVISFFWGDSIRLQNVDASALTSDDFTFRRSVITWPESQEASDANDLLIGTDDKDTLYGFGGDDSISGGGDDDYLRGYEGDDTLSGGDGDDIIGGEEGHDLIYGGAGDDFIIAHEGNDTVFGGDGDDLMETRFGDDILIGGAGADTLRAGGGDDTMTGGDGADVFVIGRLLSNNVITDFDVSEDILDYRGSGLELSDITLSSTADGVLLEADGNSLLLAGVSLLDFSENSETFFWGAGEVTSLFSDYAEGTGVDQPTEGLAAETGVVSGDAWAEVDGAPPTISYSFISYDSQEFIGSGEENGWFFASEPLTPYAQYVAEQAFADIASYTNLTFAWVEDTGISAGTIRSAYHQFVIGGASSTPYSGPYSADVFNGIDIGEQYAFTFFYHELGHSIGFGDLPYWSPVTGNDYTIMSYIVSARYEHAEYSTASTNSFMAADILGMQYMYGVNTVATAGDDIYRFDADAKGLIDTIWDYSGIDTILITGSGDPVNINLTPGSWQDIGEDILYNSYDDNGVETKSYEPGTVFIMDGVIIENVIASDGDDTVMGNTADNMLDGGAGADHLSGGDGADTLVGDLGDDSLYGGSGNDSMKGSKGNDVLEGGTGRDSLFGQNGDDHLIGGGAQDALVGGVGADTLDGGDGRSDRVTYSGSREAVSIDLAEADTFAYGAGGDAEGDVLINVEQINGSNFDDTLSGNSASNRIFGLNGDDRIDGEEGSDILKGGNGDDTLTAGEGDDRLLGNGGDDILISGAGDDTLIGGGGYDIIQIVQGGQDVVIGLNSNEDTLDLSALGFADLDAVIASSTDVDGGVLIDLGDGDSLFLKGYSVDLLDDINLLL